MADFKNLTKREINVSLKDNQPVILSMTGDKHDPTGISKNWQHGN
jgi:hypothetical protein